MKLSSVSYARIAIKIIMAVMGIVVLIEAFDLGEMASLFVGFIVGWFVVDHIMNSIKDETAEKEG